MLSRAVCQISHSIDQIIASDSACRLPLTKMFSETPGNIDISHILLKITFFGLHFYRWQYGSISNLFDVIGPQIYRILQNNTKQRPLCRSWSFKISDFVTNWKPKCNFILVINTNLDSISHRSQVIADYWSHLRFRQGVYLFLYTLVGGEPINSGPRNSASRN